MDKFPEAFRRFERVVDTRRIRSFRQLLLAFRWWSGGKWRGTTRQVEALKVEARKRRLPVPRPRPRIHREYRLKPLKPPRLRTWGHETVTVRGKPQHRFRDLKTGRFVKKPFVTYEM